MNDLATPTTRHQDDYADALHVAAADSAAVGDDPTAIRHPKRGKAHRSTLAVSTPAGWAGDTACGKWARDMTDRVSLKQTSPSPEDRCRTCWKKRA